MRRIKQIYIKTIYKIRVIDTNVIQQELMQKSVVLCYKSTRREFIISARTSTRDFKTLVRRVLNLAFEVKFLRTPTGVVVPLRDIFQSADCPEFQIVLSDASDDPSKNSHNSQMKLSKASGRKNPPSQHELVESKFYIDDLQLFMSQIGDSRKERLFGIVFFSTKKIANFLGRKILRELVFEFDQIDFFYALHPFKTHSVSKLLGTACMFTIFKGKRKIHECEFPEQITAADEIPKYIRSLIKTGELQFKKKNLISVQQHRSFDIGCSQPKQNITKNKTMVFAPGHSPLFTPNSISPIKTPVKSPLTNEISFENQFYQPDWFFNGTLFSRVEKAFLTTLAKAHESSFVSFCQGLDLKDDQKLSLHSKLIKVFINEIILDKLGQEYKIIVESNQQNRSSMVFSTLLKLHKLGNIDDFVASIKKNFSRENRFETQLPIYRPQPKNSFVLNLVNCSQIQEKKPQRFAASFLQQAHLGLASLFHNSPLPLKPTVHPIIPSEYSEAEQSRIRQLILEHDVLLTRCFCNHEYLSSDVIRNYLIRRKMEILEWRAGEMRNKVIKVKIFSSLIYYLYRRVNAKQLKVFLHLYTWSDLNVLGSFQLFLLNGDLDDFVDTVFTVDYQYYLSGYYGQLNKVELSHMPRETEMQLIMLLLLQDQIPFLEGRFALEKFIRAGDCTLYQWMQDVKYSNAELVGMVNELCREKHTQLQSLDVEEGYRDQQKKWRCEFVDSIVAVHFKEFKHLDRVKMCIMKEEPVITAIFQVHTILDQLVQWMDSFKVYIRYIQYLHMDGIIRTCAAKADISLDLVHSCNEDFLVSIYDVYLLTNDIQDATDSLIKAVSHQQK